MKVPQQVQPFKRIRKAAIPVTDNQQLELTLSQSFQSRQNIVIRPELQTLHEDLEKIPVLHRLRDAALLQLTPQNLRAFQSQLAELLHVPGAVVVRDVIPDLRLTGLLKGLLRGNHPSPDKLASHPFQESVKANKGSVGIKRNAVDALRINHPLCSPPICSGSVVGRHRPEPKRMREEGDSPGPDLSSFPILVTGDEYNCLGATLIADNTCYFLAAAYFWATASQLTTFHQALM